MKIPYLTTLFSAVLSVAAISLSADSAFSYDGRRKEWKPVPLDVMVKGWNVDESKVPSYTLPDPLSLPGGGKADEKLWRSSVRAKILEKLAVNEYGFALPKPVSTSVEVISEKTDALDGTATRREVKLTFTGTTGKKLSATMLLYIPNAVSGPVPVFLGLNFRGNHATTDENDIQLYTPAFTPTPKAVKGWKYPILKKGYARASAAQRWPYKEIIKRGYAVGTVCYHEFYPDFMGTGRYSVFALFMKDDEVDGPQFRYTPIGAWAWGLSRMLDYVSSDKRIDASKAAVIGHSRLGKTALWAGALDTRFGLVCPNNSGCGGVALHKREFGENIEGHLTHRDNDNDAFWFTEPFAEAWGKESELPYDQHEAVALIAPRTIAVGVATKDVYADPKGEYESVKAAAEVWRIHSIDVVLPAHMPRPGGAILGPISFHVREGGHNILLEDWNAYMNVADGIWRKSPAN